MPDKQIAQLMSGMHSTDDYAMNVSMTLQLLSLSNCADTIVGDGSIRGVSGGEKKRVTTGEIVVGPSKVLFMDEISTGAQPAQVVHHVLVVLQCSDALASLAALS